jgi:hypothetical protein
MGKASIRLPLSVLLFSLVACANYSGQDQNGEFYTWVDERGQLRTEQRKSKPQNPSAPPTEEKTEANKQNKPLSQLANAPDEVATAIKSIPKYKAMPINIDIDTADFTPATEVDNKLRGKKLFSWNQDGQQMIQELDLVPDTDTDTDTNTEKSKVLSSINTSFEYTRDLRIFREAKEIFLSDIISTVIRLEDRYILNEESNSDYILVELDTPLKKLSLKAFITSGKVSLPAITFLNKSYIGGEQIVDAFSELTPESWSSYGNISGSVNVPADALYLLLQPSPLSGVVETGDQNVTVGNLGKILISP